MMSLRRARKKHSAVRAAASAQLGTDRPFQARDLVSSTLGEKRITAYLFELHRSRGTGFEPVPSRSIASL